MEFGKLMKIIQCVAVVLLFLVLPSLAIYHKFDAYNSFSMYITSDPGFIMTVKTLLPPLTTDKKLVARKLGAFRDHAPRVFKTFGSLCGFMRSLANECVRS